MATFTGDLAAAFNGGIDAAEHENDRRQAATWSKDAVAFWNCQLDLHPDVLDLKNYADDAATKDAQVEQWLAQAPSAPASTEPSGQP